MFEKTSTEDAPWAVIAANYKWYARLRVLRTVVEALERAGLSKKV
jgi:polyphosphate kinase 2 (PPK2 family)